MVNARIPMDVISKEHFSFPTNIGNLEKIPKFCCIVLLSAHVMNEIFYFGAREKKKKWKKFGKKTMKWVLNKVLWKFVWWKKKLFFQINLHYNVYVFVAKEAIQQGLWVIKGMFLNGLWHKKDCVRVYIKVIKNFLMTFLLPFIYSFFTCFRFMFWYSIIIVYTFWDNYVICTPSKV